MNPHAMNLLDAGARELGIKLAREEMASFDLFAEELKKWSKKINITAITDDAGIAVKHFIDSLSLLKVVRPPGRLLDIGSGAGFPSLPMKIVAPDLDIVSVDAVVKKISFQKQMVRLLKLTQFNATHLRAETLGAEYPEYFDWVVSRAFSDLVSFVTLALPLLKQDGRIVAMKGRNAAQEIAAAEAPLAGLGARVAFVRDFQLPGGGDARSLVVVVKHINSG